VIPLDRFDPTAVSRSQPATSPVTPYPTPAGSVFIVHGRNHTVRDIIDLFLTKDLGLKTVVMEAGPFAGRTLPEKFEELARSSAFAIFVLTADDALVDTHTGTEIRRARQNVILEVGFFWGAFGRRGRVAFLVENDPRMDLPSDIQGMGWIPITADLAQTKMRLEAELRNAGVLKPKGG
jgi:predicted nucleotide-binding protein